LCTDCVRWTTPEHKARQNPDHLAALDWVDSYLAFCTQIGTQLMWRNVIERLQEGLRRPAYRACMATEGPGREADGVLDRV
jgi:hypothetical protein